MSPWKAPVPNTDMTWRTVDTRCLWSCTCEISAPCRFHAKLTLNLNTLLLLISQRFPGLCTLGETALTLPFCLPAEQSVLYLRVWSLPAASLGRGNRFLKLQTSVLLWPHTYVLELFRVSLERTNSSCSACFGTGSAGSSVYALSCRLWWYFFSGLNLHPSWRS